jgi:sugar lactone lactonase YvrE
MSALPAGRVFFDGLMSNPRLAHPEGVAVAPDGSIWCGTENGELMRIAADGSAMERMAQGAGFVLGIAFDSVGNLYACDFIKACIWKRDTETGAFAVYAKGPRIPNYPVVDLSRNCLYVSDSGGFGEVGPGVWRYDLATGQGALWCGHAFTFANGMALAPDGQSLSIVETFGKRVSSIQIKPDGSAGAVSLLCDGIGGLPDGLAYDSAGSLFISCYEPSRIYRYSTDGHLSIYFEDVLAHLMCHPTNIAFRGSTLFTANLGRWHVTAIETETSGLSLPLRVAA